MFKLRPVTEEQASPQIKEAYQDIKQTLSVEIVPLVFQYIANYERYLLFLWQQMKINVASEEFKTAYSHVTQIAQQTTGAIYKKSHTINQFASSLHGEEKRAIINTVFLLEHINAILLLLTIAVRESLKGVNIGQQQLASSAVQTTLDQMNAFAQETGMSFGNDRHELDATATMLSPIFGSQAIQVSHYPEFFSHIAQDMDKLIQTEAYLKARVFLEQKTMQATTTFPSPLGCSYAELVEMVRGKPHFDELLFLLVDTFPSQFPRLVFTTAVMELVLGIQDDASKEVIANR